MVELSFRDHWKVKAMAQIVLDAIETDHLRVWMVEMLVHVSRAYGYNMDHYTAIFKHLADGDPIPESPSWALIVVYLKNRALPGEAVYG